MISAGWQRISAGVEHESRRPVQGIYAALEETLKRVAVAGTSIDFFYYLQ
jgi:hypothetical protein